jgi:uncharacterized protein YabE (DUF348 family)
MRNFLNRYRRWLFPLALAAVMGGLVLMWLGFRQTLFLIVDGETTTIKSHSFTVAGVLRQAGFSPDDLDRTAPSPNRWFWNLSQIEITRSQKVYIKSPSEDFDVISADKIPANLLLDAGIALFPGDQILLNGVVVDPGQPLEIDSTTLLQFKPAIALSVTIDDETQTLYTAQPTLGAALESAGISLSPADWISEPLNRSLTEPLSVTIRRAQPMTVTTPTGTLTGLTSALTVGQALDDLGLPLQGLFYSQPDEDAPLPEDRQIEVVHVREELLIATEEVPFTSEYREDPDTPLDQASVIQPGQVGIFATRERVHYENDEETWRLSDPTWQASEPQTAIVGYGTDIVVQTAVVEGETLEYYRTLTVWTTSYKPCDTQGNCYYGTSSGLPVEKGVIAVSYDWYLLLQGQRLYVPGYGYGVIADVCGGCVGKPWIDLGYSEEGYNPTPNRWVTVYLLTPVPGYVPVFLP